METVLDYCLSYCCMCCSCYAPRTLDDDLYEPLLLDEERAAVNELLNYLNREYEEKPTLSEERLRAINILTYSRNDDLQRSAALCLAEISERLLHPINNKVMEPLLTLMESRDIETQKAASLALSNLALHGHDVNKEVIMRSGALQLLIKLLRSPNEEIQCNVCGCITTLATTDANKKEIVSCGGVPPLINLARSPDMRVKRNATGALLNLTHIDSTRTVLVSHGAVPLFVASLHSDDSEIQYYCAAALSNLAVDATHRASVVQAGNNKVLRQLIRLLESPSEKVKCQACFALRNLASDEDNQVTIVEFGALPPLHRIMETCTKDTVAAAVAALRNLSIHRRNEMPIVRESFLLELGNLLREPMSWDAHCHAAGTIRNLAAGDQLRAIVEKGTLDSLIVAFMRSTSPLAVQSELTAALAVLSADEQAKAILVNAQDWKVFSKLISLAANSHHADVQYNSAGTIDLKPELITANILGLLRYIERFVKHPDPSFIHIGLWTSLQLLKDATFRTAFGESAIPRFLEGMQQRPSLPLQIQQLAQTVLDNMG
ncbi:vacuolar protein 8-like [Acanthaster planci]|uniref:Vacuolar protein 8 n=1 Tax=Acanthaster planci TaxID=133434 RepID=A0A8B7Z773_ACAPL|nr:vacuolar protein 8-like [Acanthaster planci]